MATREDFYHRMFGLVQSSDLIPDIGIDTSLLKYSGLESASELESSINKMLKDKTPDYIKSLGSALSAFKSVPTAVGLGALVVSIALELIIRAGEEEKESKDSTVDMMRRVFAEEKASGVRDSMEEYMKRLHMYINDPTRVLDETQRLEKQLSEQLTCLKNSMLYDNQMSSRSLKHWANGAAFHLQMLIHVARLEMQKTKGHEDQLHTHLLPINTVLECYQNQLVELLKQYKTYKKSTISVCRPVVLNVLASARFLVVRDEEFGRETSAVIYNIFMPIGSSDGYVDYMFNNWDQLKELEQYFKNLKGKIKELILQNDEFNVQTVLPVRDEQDAEDFQL